MQGFGRWLVIATVYVGCAQFAFLAFLQNPGNPDDFEAARLTGMVDGTAHRPFVYRTLLASTVRAIRRERFCTDFSPRIFQENDVRGLLAIWRAPLGNCITPM